MTDPGHIKTTGIGIKSGGISADHEGGVKGSHRLRVVSHNTDEQGNRSESDHWHIEGQLDNPEMDPSAKHTQLIVRRSGSTRQTGTLFAPVVHSAETEAGDVHDDSDENRHILQWHSNAAEGPQDTSICAGRARLTVHRNGRVTITSPTGVVRDIGQQDNSALLAIIGVLGEDMSALRREVQNLRNELDKHTGRTIDDHMTSV